MKEQELSKKDLEMAKNYGGSDFEDWSEYKEPNDKGKAWRRMKERELSKKDLEMAKNYGGSDFEDWSEYKEPNDKGKAWRRKL